MAVRDENVNCRCGFIWEFLLGDRNHIWHFGGALFGCGSMIFALAELVYIYYVHPVRVCNVYVYVLLYIYGDS
jgi:hypothetical protein